MHLEERRRALFEQLATLQAELDALTHEFVDLAEPLIRQVLEQLHIEPNSPLAEDLAQTARVALLQRWRDYDPTKSSLSTYCAHVIRTAMRSHLYALRYAEERKRGITALLEIDAPVRDAIDAEYLAIRNALTPDEWKLLQLFYLDYAHLPEAKRYEKIRFHFRMREEEAFLAIRQAIEKLEAALRSISD